MTELCKDCSSVIANPLSTPMHLVHPEHGAHMFDSFDVAVCPSCSTRWFRDHKGAVRMERRSRRPWPFPSWDQDAPANWVSVPASAAVAWASRVGWLALTNPLLRSDEDQIPPLVSLGRV